MDKEAIAKSLSSDIGNLIDEADERNKETDEEKLARLEDERQERLAIKRRELTALVNNEMTFGITSPVKTAQSLAEAEKRRKERIREEMEYYTKLLRRKSATNEKLVRAGKANCIRCGGSGWTWSIGFINGFPQLKAHWCKCARDEYWANQQKG